MSLLESITPLRTCGWASFTGSLRPEISASRQLAPYRAQRRRDPFWTFETFLELFLALSKNRIRRVNLDFRLKERGPSRSKNISKTKRRRSSKKARCGAARRRLLLLLRTRLWNRRRRSFKFQNSKNFGRFSAYLGFLNIPLLSRSLIRSSAGS